jgi:hypothetical protein
MRSIGARVPAFRAAQADGETRSIVMHPLF